MGRKDGKCQNMKSAKPKPKNTKAFLNTESDSVPSTSKAQTREKREDDKNHSETDVSKAISKGLSTREIEEKEQYIERLLTSLKDHKNADKKGEYIERVINTISDLLQLEESLEAESLPEMRKDEREEEQKKEKDVAKEEQEQFCAYCKAASSTRCTGCRLVFYCDKDCQRKDWKLHKDVCRPYTIAKRKDVGRILVASRDLKAEDLILYESPLVIGPRSGSTLSCISCYRRITGKYRCTVCNLPLCSEHCEKGEEHSSYECQLAKGVPVKLQMNQDTPDRLYDAIAGLRCLIAQRREHQRWKSSLERYDLKFLTKIGSSESNEEIKVILKGRLNIHSHPELAAVTDDEIHQILGLLQIHNVPTKLPYGDAQGLYPMASLLSHSCIPNTKLIWDKACKKLKIIATETIPRGSPITTIYTDILWGTRARRNHLQQTRLIACTCNRCKDPTELDTYFSALVCQQCPKRSFVLPLDPLNNNTQWNCRDCSYQLSSEDVLQQTLSLGANVSEALQSPSIESLEALQTEWGSKFSFNHYHLHAIKHSLLQLYARSQEKAEDKDDQHWDEIAKKEKACKEFLRVCALLDPALANTVPYVGLTFFEYHKTILQNAKKSYGLAKINIQQLKKRMLLSKELLRKAMEIFREEEPDTPEGQLYLTCQEERITIGKWMLAVGLV